MEKGGKKKKDEKGPGHPRNQSRKKREKALKKGRAKSFTTETILKQAREKEMERGKATRRD